jgi:hypothetical protein
MHRKTMLQDKLLIYLHAQKHRLEAAGITKHPAPKLVDIFGRA